MSVGTTQSSATLTDVVMPGTSVTPGAGDYVVHLSAGFVGPSTGVEHAVVSIYHNGVQVGASERIMFLEANRFDTVSTVAHITAVGAADTIDARWRTLGGAAISLRERTLVTISVE